MSHLATTPPSSPSFSPGSCADEIAAALEALETRRQRGEPLLAPFSFRQLEAMAQRLPEQTGPVRRVLLARFHQALARHDTLVQSARQEAQMLAESLMAERPDQTREARRLLAAGDLSALRQLDRQLNRQLNRQRVGPHESPLTGLRRHLEQLAPVDMNAAPAMVSGTTRSKPDMKSLRLFKDSWARIAAEDDLKQASERAPQNAGPLNSHQLVLRSLNVMRDVSPDYLRRFMSHLDALLWLDQLSQRPSASDIKPKARSGKPPKGKEKAPGHQGLEGA